MIEISKISLRVLSLMRYRRRSSALEVGALVVDLALAQGVITFITIVNFRCCRSGRAWLRRPAQVTRDRQATDFIEQTSLMTVNGVQPRFEATWPYPISTESSYGLRILTIPVHPLASTRQHKCGRL